MELHEELAEEFSKVAGVTVRRGLLGSNYTTFAIGGPISYLAEINTKPQAQHVLRSLKSQGIRFFILGAGSNVLMPSSGMPGWVLKLGRGFKYLKPLELNEFEVGAATSLMSLSREVSETALSGLEFAGGIPASVGGAVRMNAGAHGGEMSGIVNWVELVMPDGELIRQSSSELEFLYRQCSLPVGSLVTSLGVKLVPGNRAKILENRAKNLAERKAAQPLTLPSAGSVFRNPSKELTAGKLIETLGLKGRKIGGAQISEKHGNWIVNPDRLATDKDVLDLIHLCQTQSKILEPEIIVAKL